MYSLFISTIKLTYEYSIVQQFILQFINLSIGLLVYSLYSIKNKENVIIYHIVRAAKQHAIA